MIKIPKYDRTKVVKNLAGKDVLSPYLDKVMQEYDEPWTFDYTAKEHDNAWHPSGDCTPVASKLYEKALSDEHERHSSSLKKSFMVGHFWHQWIQHVVVSKLGFADPSHIEAVGYLGWEVTGEQDRYGQEIFMPYHWVRGSGDFAPLETPKWRGIVDIKTMSSNQFKQATLPEWAAVKYLCQLNIYMHLFDEEKGMIFAVNKDAPHDFREFHYTRDDELVEAIVKKWKFVSECLDNEIPPTEEDDERHALPIRSN